MLTLELQTFITELIRITNRVSAEKFKETVMEHLQGLIPFDMALWAGGYTDGLQLNSVFLHNLPDSLMDNWEQVKHQDRLLAGLIANPGHTYDILDYYSRYERSSLEIYTKHSKLFGIENAISTALPNPDTGLLEIMSLYRNSAERPFSSDERLIKQFLFPIIANAWYQNQIRHLIDLVQISDAIFVVLCDRKGSVRVAESGFTAIIKEQWPEWSGPVLPEPILNWIDQGKERPFIRNTIRYYRERVNDLILIKALPRGYADFLTKREEEIAELFSSGLTHKQIACRLCLSPSTVRRHIESIYKKLKVSKKLELRRVLDSPTFQKK